MYVPLGGHGDLVLERPELDDREVVERQHVVLLRLLEPERLELLELVGVLARRGRAPRSGPRRCGRAASGPRRTCRDRSAPGRAPRPPSSPCARSRACPASRSTGLLLGRRVGGVERVAHRHARKRGLLVPVDDLRHLDAAAFEDRRDDVGDVVVLAAHLAPRLDALRPVDHERVADAALVLE